MKNKKLLLLMLSVILVLTVCVLAACNPNEDGAKYTVTFSLGEYTEGTAPEAQQVAAGQSIILPRPEARDKYDFGGWSDGTNIFQAGDNYTVNGDVTLTAVWTPKGGIAYTVHFDLGEYAEGQAPEDRSVVGTTRLPDAPTRDGYSFLGWKCAADGEVYAADYEYTVTADVTFTAQWGDAGEGTKEDPYVIYTPQDLVQFAYNVNHPDEKSVEDWYEAYFRLGADIDMSGVGNYIPAGSRAIDGEVVGFGGVFDGDGHTISNLNINVTVRASEFVGLFGATVGATVRNLNIEGMKVTVESNADSSSIAAYVGGIAGAAVITSISNVHTEIEVATKLLASNVAHIGGIAGTYQLDSVSGGVEIWESSNLYSDIYVHMAQFESGSAVSALDSAYVGGIYGSILGSYSGVSIINASAKGNISGGKYLGGIVGYVQGDYTSIINAVSAVDLSLSAVASSSGTPHAGGIIGACYYDIVLMDCYASSDIVGTEGSYIGDIAGGLAEDDYEEYPTYGGVAINCKYSGTLQGGDILEVGEQIQKDAFNKAYAIDELRFAEESWNFDEDGNAIPTSVLPSEINDGKHTVTLVNGTSKQSIERGGDGQYALLGAIDDPEDIGANKVFWDWQFEDGSDYRAYLPVIKDMTLTAATYDVSDILGTYDGQSSYGGGSDASPTVQHVGVITLHADGTMDYLTSLTGVTDSGEYKYDGERFVAVLESGDILCGTLIDGVIEYIWTEGSTVVTYTWTKTEEDIDPLGEYFSEDGDLISFTGTSQVTLILGDLASSGGGSAITAGYTKADNVVTLTGLSSYYSSATITLNEQGFETNFVGAFDDDGYTIAPNHKKQFTKLGAVNYSGKSFIGLNNTLYMSDDYQDDRTITFAANGTLTSSFSSTAGRYYVFGSKVIIIIDSYISTFTYDETLGIMYGVMNRGWTAKSQTIIAPEADGAIKGFIIGKTRNDVVFVTNKGQYYMKNGALQKEAVIDGTFADGSTVTIDDKQYIAAHSLHNENWHAYTLTEVDKAYGTYTLDGKTYTLNGVGEVTGDFNGYYLISDDIVIAYNLNTGDIVAFDYVAAKAAGGQATLAEHDGYQGIYYNDKESVKYYAVIISGFGKTVAYSKYSGEYSGVWGDEIGTYTVLANGNISAQYNSAQKPDFSFYYGKQIFFASGDSMTLRDKVFYKAGYSGKRDIPTFDESKFGKYTGNDVQFELKSDYTGTYNGTEFAGRLDDVDKVVFKIEDVEYTFDAKALTLKHDEVTVDLTVSTEPDENPIANTVWKGTLTKTEGMTDGDNGKEVEITFTDSQVTIKHGNFEFSANYTYSSAKGIEVKASDFTSNNAYSVDSITLTLSNGKLEFSYRIDDGDYPFAYTSMLEKQASEEEGGVEGVYVGTLQGDSGMNGQTVTITLEGNNITMVINELTFTGTYTYDDASKTITTTDIVEKGYSYDVEGITLKFEDSVLKLTLNLCQDGDYYFDYTADLNKQGGESEDVSIEGTYKGTLKKEEGMGTGVDGEAIEITITASTITIKFSTYEYSADYTYSDGISVNPEDFGSSNYYAVTAITLTLEGDAIKFSITIEEEYDSYKFIYSSTLTKQA